MRKGGISDQNAEARSLAPTPLVSDVAQAAPESRSLASVGARRVAAGAAGRVGGAELVEDVASATAANVGHDGGLVADLGAGELLVKGHDRASDRGVGVAGTAAARVESGAAASDGHGGGDLGGDAGRGSRLGGAEEVAGTATARVGVAVLGHGRVWLGDEVGRHLG